MMIKIPAVSYCQSSTRFGKLCLGDGGLNLLLMLRLESHVFSIKPIQLFMPLTSMLSAIHPEWMAPMMGVGETIISSSMRYRSFHIFSLHKE